MRATLAILLTALVLAPGALADEALPEPEMAPLDHGPDDSHDSPGVGVIALAGVAAVGAMMRRQRN